MTAHCSKCGRARHGTGEPLPSAKGFALFTCDMYGHRTLFKEQRNKRGKVTWKVALAPRFKVAA